MSSDRRALGGPVGLGPKRAFVPHDADRGAAAARPVRDRERRPDRAARKAALWAITASIVLAVSLIIGEVGLRLIGLQPWRHRTLHSGEPKMLEGDPVLGWRNKPGVYLVPAYSSLGRDIEITVGPEGDRMTSEHAPHENDASIVVVGGSFTFGWAVSDEETFAWKLQQRNPQSDVANFGTAGYGTYQSYLLLEQLFETADEPPHVLYGFIEHHEERNIATTSWLDILDQHSERGHVAVPYVTVNGDGELVRHEPTSRIGLPLRDSFAVVYLFDKAWKVIRTRQQARHQRRATELLLLEMDRLARDHGSEFAVVMLKLGEPVKREYQAFIRRHGIKALDCAFSITDELRVPGEGHPNGSMHSRWAECIGDGLARLGWMSPRVRAGRK